MPTKGFRFAAWVRMAPMTHTSERAELHCAYCSQPCMGRGDHMVCACPLVLDAALVGFRAACTLLQTRGYAVRWRDTGGATIYDRTCRTTHRRLARDEDVVTQSESATWDVAIAWSGLVWARAPQARGRPSWRRTCGRWPTRWRCCRQPGGRALCAPADKSGPWAYPAPTRTRAPYCATLWASPCARSAPRPGGLSGPRSGVGPGGARSVP